MGVQAAHGGPGWSQSTGGCGKHHGRGPASFVATFSVISGGNMQHCENIENSKTTMMHQWMGVQANHGGPDLSPGMGGCSGLCGAMQT